MIPEPVPIQSIGEPCDVTTELDQQFPVERVISWLSRYDIEVLKTEILDAAITEMSRQLTDYEGDFVLIQGDGFVQPKVGGWIGITQFKPEPLIDAFAQDRIDDFFMYHPKSDQFFSAQTEEYEYWIIRQASDNFPVR